MSKHLTYDDRLNIQDLLKSGSSISYIARKLNRHKSTISREITLRAMFRKVFSESTLYSLIDKGLLSAKNIDLPRKVRYRVRKKYE